MSGPIVYAAIDEETFQLLIAALDSHRDVVLGNIDTAVSDEERIYFEGTVEQIDEVMTALYDAGEKC